MSKIRRIPARGAAIALFVLAVGTAFACGPAAQLGGLMERESSVTGTSVGRPAAAVAPAAPPSARSAPQVQALAQAPAPAPQPAADAANAKSAAAGQAGEALSTVAAATQTYDRMVIRNAKLNLQVSSVEEAMGRVGDIARAGGGSISASNTRTERVNDQDRMLADVTIQVRADALDSTMQSLRALGKVDSENTSSQDVTEEYVDLDSNLRNLQASEAAIVRLLDKATRIEDVVSLQRELTNVRGQIERIQGRKRFIERRSDMATVAVSLHLPPVEGVSAPGGRVWDPAAAFQRGWQASLVVLRGITDALLVGLAFSWWLIPFVALGGYVVYQRRRPRAAT